RHGAAHQRHGHRRRPCRAVGERRPVGGGSRLLHGEGPDAIRRLGRRPARSPRPAPIGVPAGSGGGRHRGAGTMTIFGFHVSGDVIVLGLVTGMVYGILAVGLVLVYRATRIINFAHGEIGAFGAALLGVAVTKGHVAYWFAFVFAIAVSAAIGAASEIVVIRRLRTAPLVVS